MPVENWVKDLVAGVIQSPKYDVGSVVVINGRRAKITSGQYWGERGLSNHWHWKYLDNKNPREDCGYGGDWKPAKRQK